MKALIIGGTSGLGLELAKLLKSDYAEVVITGRRDPSIEGLVYEELPLDVKKGSTSGSDFWDLGLLLAKLDYIVSHHQPFETVIYNAGFYQEGHISDLADEDILSMTSVGFMGAGFLLNRVLKKQSVLPTFVVVTSTSQFFAREKEPVYSGVKAGLGKFAESLSLDLRVRKTLIAAPAGMQTKFWDGTDKDTSTMLDPAWVAEQIITMLQGDYSFHEALILRGPPTVKPLRTRWKDGKVEVHAVA